jgi:hypothetical protein
MRDYASRMYQCIENDNKVMQCYDNMSFTNSIKVSVPECVHTSLDPLVLSWKLKRSVLVFRHNPPSSSNGEGSVWNAGGISMLGKAN